MNGSRRPTLKDIADTLGLSTNTVSRALAGKDNVNEATRQRIRGEAERIGYVPNSHARSLVLGSNSTLGLVITNPSNPLYAQLISGVEMRAKVNGYSLLLLVSEENLDREQLAVESLMRSAVDGAIAVPVQGEHQHWERLTYAGIPLVLANRDIDELGTDFVGIDNEKGAYEATKHLIGLGAQRLWVLEEDLPITTISSRIRGFEKAMSDGGLSVADSTIVAVPARRHESSTLPWQAEEAYRLSRELLAQARPPDAVVVGNDYFALGLMRAIESLGLRVPQDVMVTGYGDHPYASFLTPPLSTVRLPGFEVGVQSVDLLLERREDPEAEPHKKMLDPVLVVRGSSDDSQE